jgi:Tfp pilus assembly protein PilO
MSARRAGDPAIWREKRVLLIVLAALLLANTVFFFTYRVQYQSRLDALDERLAEVEQQRDQARAARAHAEQTLRAYRKVENDVATIFAEHWSTQAQRLTALISEVKRLAVASGLVPPTYTFARGEVKAEAVPGARTRRERVGANEVSITFTVNGSYEQVRRLINLLELSRQFVIIERISLTSADSQTLTLSLGLKTLFRDEDSALARNRL